ncbi:MAG: LytS/YhcK type 5TM receptor domain-containing protein [Armatimonadota bacterium]
MIYLDLIYNLALLIALSIVSGFIRRNSTRSTQHAVLQGLLFGVTVMIGMISPLEITAGLFFDGRSVIISLCALFFGPVAVAITSTIAIVLRYYQGGIGTLTGISVILSSTLIGLIYYYSHHHKTQQFKSFTLWIFGIVVHIFMLILMFTLPLNVAMKAITQIALPVIIIYPLATILVGKILSDQLANDRYMKELSSSREQFRTTLFSIGDAVITTDTSGSISLMNNVAESLTGWSIDEAQGRKLSEVFNIVSEETLAPVEDPSVRVLDEGAVVGLANHTLLIAKDGTQRAIADSGAPIRNEAGAVTGVVLVFHDQTSERLAEQQLRESESKYRALFENMASGSCLSEVVYKDGVAVDYRIWEVNPAFGRILGIDPSCVDGKLASEVYGTTDIPFFGIYTKVAKTGHPGCFEGYFAPGHKHLQITVGCPRPNFFSTVFIDITERKQAEERLKSIEWMLSKKPTGQRYEREALSTDVSAPSHSGIITRSISHHTLMTIISDVLDLLGTSISIYEDTGDCVLNAITSGWSRLINTIPANRIHQDAPSTGVCNYTTSTVSRQTMMNAEPQEATCLCGLQIYSVPVFAGGQAVGAISLGYGDPPVDIDVLQKLSDEYQLNLSELQREAAAYDTRPPYIIEMAKQRLQSAAQLIGYMVEAKTAENQRAAMELQLRQVQKMDAVGRLAGGVAHDFNNMLSVILGYADIAMKQLSPSDPIYDDINEIHKAGQRSAELTNQLLAFSRNQVITPKVLDVNRIIPQMLNMLRRLLGEHLNLTWTPCIGPLWIRMDNSQLDQILANLLVNAKDALPNGGHVTIKTCNSTLHEPESDLHTDFIAGDYVKIQVIDDGCGMDDATITNLFEPFFTTKPTGHGTGLGLATVYGIIKQNRGMVGVTSKPGCGSTFTIYIPRYNPGTTIDSSEKPRNTDYSGDETVLVVEDETAVLQLAESILTRRGYKVLTSSQPHKAISLAESYDHDIHLVITDVVMPVMNGKELHDRIRSIRPSIKTIFMSGYTADVIANNGILDDDAAFLQKPFTNESLAQLVRDTLDNRRSNVV